MATHLPLSTTVPTGDSVFPPSSVRSTTWRPSTILRLLVLLQKAHLDCAVLQSPSAHVNIFQPSYIFDPSNLSSDSKRRLLKKARNPPGSKSPLKFDAYTLNHAALVGRSEVTFDEYFSFLPNIFRLLG